MTLPWAGIRRRRNNEPFPDAGGDGINVQAMNMGRIVVDVDGVNLSELINKVSENGYLLRVVDKSDQHAPVHHHR